MNLPYHFIGIGGIEMSGLARILLKKKIPVSGSDLSENRMTALLKNEGANIVHSHTAENIKAGMTVIYSSSIREENPELQAAKQLNCPVLHRSDLLHLLLSNKKALVVAGTHGKTSTSALLTWTLQKGGSDPSYAVGGVIGGTLTNAEEGSGEYFVAEGDESDGTFVNYHPEGGIITNIGLDHMEFYHTENAVVSAFNQFADQVKQKKLLYLCGDCPRITSLNLQGKTYGFGQHHSIKGSRFNQTGWSSTFDVEHDGDLYSAITLSIPGKHQALNALGVFGLALSLGISEKAIRGAFATFPGVGRRSEKKGEHDGMVVIDDYAHHPTEIRATLLSLREVYPERRIIAVLQPHRYSRVAHCRGQFADMFPDVDHVLVTDVYSAGEPPIPGVSHQTIIDELQENVSFPVNYFPRGSLAEKLADLVKSNDVVVTLGAGDITHAGKELLDVLQNKVKIT